MQTNLVLTLTGHDRIGIVERVTKEVLNFGGNIQASRMSRLGGEFAMLMLVSINTENYDELREGILRLQDEGYSVITCQTERADPAKFNGWMPYQVEVHGADHDGIIHHITQRLAKHNINIETMDTNMKEAPMSGTPLFSMTATVLVPPDFSYRTLQRDLEAVGDEMNVDTEVFPFKG